MGAMVSYVATEGEGSKQRQSVTHDTQRRPPKFLVPKSCATTCTCCTQAQNITNIRLAVEPVSQLATKSH